MPHALRPRGSAPPGPRGLPVLGALAPLARDPIGFCQQAQRAHGDVVRLRIGPASVYLVVHPDYVEQVLVAENDNHHKGRLFKRTSVLFGNGVVLNDGASWAGQRTLMTPSFSRARLEGTVPEMVEIVERAIARWQERADPAAPVDMAREMMLITLRVVALVMFSRQIADRQLETLAAAFDAVLRHLAVRLATFAFPEWVPLPGQRACARALALLDSVVDDLMEQRLRATERPPDLLTALVETRDEAGRPMDRRQIRDEVITTLFGGYEATAHSLAWTWYLLAAHPEADARFRAEVDAVLADETPTLDHLRRLEFTRRVIDESLRLYPPFWEVLRTSYGPSTLGGYALPGGAAILLCPYITHRHPDFWDEPEAFRPDRFERPGVPAHRHAHYPFGAGRRMCIGKHLALLEMQLILAMVAREFRPTLPLGHTVDLRAHSTVRPKGGMPMVLTPNTPARAQTGPPVPATS